jgi:phytoene synthase
MSGQDRIGEITAEPTPADRRAVSDLVRSGDRDRYWAALFAPRALREDLLALYAFNLEIARIPYLVSEPMVGQIRLQWWRDAIDLASQGTRSGNPVADALAMAIRRHALPKAQLQGMVSARLFDIYTEPMAGIPELKAYLNETAGALFAASLQVLGVRSTKAESAAQIAGLAYGLTALLRALPLHTASGRVFLPLPSLQAGGAPNATRLAAELADVRASARSNLERFREVSADLPTEARPAFLLLALVEPMLARMERPGFQQLRHVVELPPLTRFWRIWKAVVSGTI